MSGCVIEKDSEFIINSLSESNISYVTDSEKEILSNFTANNFSVLSHNKDNENIGCPKIYNFERPDLVVEFEEFILSVEHFQVDASNNGRSGSSFKKKYNSKILWEHSENVEKISKEIDCNICYENLFLNTLKHFEKHYRKINDYVNNINNHFGATKPIKKWFFIEYNVVFHSFFIQNSKRILMTPDFDIRFFEFLIKNKQLDGIIVYYNKESNLRFISNTAENLKKYMIGTDVFDVNKIEIFDYTNPHMIELKIK